MNNIFKYILVLSFVAAAAMSCVDDIDSTKVKSPDVTFVARMTDYSYRGVNSKSLDLAEFETEVKSLYFIVFDDDGNRIAIKDGNLGSLSVAFNSEDSYKEVTVCCIANMRQTYVRDSLLTLSDLNDTYYKVNYAPVEETGCVGIPVYEDGSYAIPMVGVIEDLDFSAVGAKPYPITLRRLFSKVVVNFGLNLGNDIDSSEKPFFRFSEYTVSGLPEYVRLAETEEESDYKEFLKPQTIVMADEKLYDKEDPYTFVLYFPESLVEPNITTEMESESWYAERDQRYKPVLAEGLNAPCVSLSGSYLPLGDTGQGAYNLEYDIYLGENNFDSFSLRRNVLYNNDVTIRGFSGVGWEAEVDHRVDVEVNGFVVGFERTALLDSHYEVRPLRVKFDESFSTEGEVFVQILNADDESAEIPSWVRLERPLTTGGVYCDNSTKRRYFTTDLVSGILAESGREISYNPLASREELLGEVPVWVYIDEYSAASADEFSTETRRARVRVGFKNHNGDTLYYQDYTIGQRAVYPIKLQSLLNTKTYGMEFHEEYLYNYDVIPDFDDVPEVDTKTKQGLVWGLDDLQLSRNKRSVYTDDVKITDVSVSALGMNLPMSSIESIASLFPSAPLSSMMNVQIGQAQGVLPYYDFYNTADSKSVNVPSLVARDYEGYEMNVEIIHNLLLNNSSEASAKLNGIGLNEDELSVIAYCYNKNTRDADGNVATLVEGQDSLINTSNLHWYAPSVAEIEGIVSRAYSMEDEFSVFADNLYWSCQPSYDRGEVTSDFTMNVSQPVSVPILGTLAFTLDAKIAIKAEGKGLYLMDDLDRARATRYDTSTGKTVSSSVSGSNHIIRMSSDSSSELTKIELTTAERDSLLTMLNIDIKDLMSGNLGNLVESLTTDEIVWLAKFIIGKFNFQSLIADFKAILSDVTKVDWDVEQESVPESELSYNEGNMSRKSMARVRCLYNPNPPKQYRRSPNTLSNGGYIYEEVAN